MDTVILLLILYINRTNSGGIFNTRDWFLCVHSFNISEYIYLTIRTHTSKQPVSLATINGANIVFV